MVTILRYGQGTCMWCTNDAADCASVEFKDSFAGTLCWRCLKSAIKTRAAKANGKPPSPATVVRNEPTGNPPGNG